MPRSAAMVLGDDYQVTFQGTLDDGSVWENVHHFNMFSQGGSGLNEGQVIDDMDTGWRTQFLQLLSIQCAVTAFRLQHITVAGHPVSPESRSAVAGLPAAGAIAGDAMPNLLAGVISWQTAKTGPRYRGRTYLPPGGESSNDTFGKPSAAYIALVNAWLGVFTPTVTIAIGANSVGLKQVILSRKFSTIEPVVNGLLATNWGTQRRRKPGRGI